MTKPRLPRLPTRSRSSSPNGCWSTVTTSPRRSAATTSTPRSPWSLPIPACGPHSCGVNGSWVAERGAGVVEGRDIASVVLPDAEVKVYLTASEAERARRRAEEQGQLGSPDPLEAARASITARDSLDSTRSDSPLVVADGAVVIDSTEPLAGERDRRDPRARPGCRRKSVEV